MSTDMTDTAKKTILFVDDEPSVLSSVRRLLRREGWKLVTATGGQEGLEQLEAQPVDLVVSDMRMPGMDGAAFLKEVKARYPNAVRIILSGYSERDAVTRAFADADIHDMISKPWDDDQLKAIIRNALHQSDTQDQELEGLHQIINAVDTLPALPRTYQEVCRAVRNADDTSTEAVADVILREPAISARILQMANSAFFGQRRQVDSLSRALVVLGLDMVEKLVLCLGVFHAFPGPEVEGLRLRDLWRHSLACGLAARRLLVERKADRRR